MKKDAPVPTAARKKKKASPSRFQVSMKKATTEMLTLFLLRQKPMYTYEMMQEIDTLSGGAITFNTLYQPFTGFKAFNILRSTIRWWRATGCASTLPLPSRGRPIWSSSSRSTGTSPVR